jgi:hypothetical protein
MLISEILSSLPAALEWMVLFRLSKIRPLAEDSIVKQMFHLCDDLNLDLYSHVILSSNGGYLAPEATKELIDVSSGQSYQFRSSEIENSLDSKFARQLSHFDVDRADCIGVGETAPFPPVVLYLEIKSGYGEAKAIFAKEPPQTHYELLKAVGVEFLGGQQYGEEYVARFKNRLPVHIHAGILSHFNRTGNCNLFFLRHGNINAELEIGLLRASESRINWGKNLGMKLLSQIGSKACTEMMAMKCQSLQPAQSFSYGNLVPLGFVLKALNKVDLEHQYTQSRQEISAFLLSKQQQGLWSFHTDGLVTSTDSVLVLQGFEDRGMTEALEVFADNNDILHSYHPHTYVPQLASEIQQPGAMLMKTENKHWCQPDYATTCLVKAARGSVGLEDTETEDSYLEQGFNTRSGMFFANPYMVDWALASALSTNKSSSVQLKDRLISEILASINSDYSFGKYDTFLSTAFAIISLSKLGCKNRVIRLSQLRLLEFIDSNGNFPGSTPFYSTLMIDFNKITPNRLFQLSMSDFRKQIIKVKDQYHSISFYDDIYTMIGAAVGTLALSKACNPKEAAPNLDDLKQHRIHPRYQCLTHSDYIAKFALPPYLADVAPANNMVEVGS